MSSKVSPVPALDLTLIEGEWDFAAREATAIEAHWTAECAKSDYLFNGKVLIAPEFGFTDGGQFFARHLAVDYSAFLTWRDLYQPQEPADQPKLVNIFGSAVVISQEGHMLMGVMADYTSNPGMIYPASGMPDLRDVADDGSMDLFASLGRELKEEMGLDASNARWGDALMIEDGWRKCIAQMLYFDQSAEQLLLEIKKHLAVAEDDELADVAVITSVDDIDEVRMPSYVPELIRYYYSR